MRLPKRPLFRSTCVVLLPACLLTAAVAAASPALSTPGEGTKAPPPPPASCWAITGPFNDGRETFFEASNKCDSARHCQVWVRGHEPPYMIHLEPGSSGRIDVGETGPDDYYSRHCQAVGITADQGH
jgi:hypothetical protein